MCLTYAPDFAQQLMEQVLSRLDHVKCQSLIDDIGWKKHLLLIDKVMSHLDAHGFTVNPLIWTCAIQEINWLGYWLTPTVLKSWNICIFTNLEQEPPHNMKEMCGFLCAIDIYRLM